MADREMPSNDEIDAELSLAIMGYDPRDQYPEWSNAAMREAYRAGWEDGRGLGWSIMFGGPDSDQPIVRCPSHAVEDDRG